VSKIKKQYIESRKKGIPCIQSSEGSLTGLVTLRAGTAF